MEKNEKDLEVVQRHAISFQRLQGVYTALPTPYRYLINVETASSV